MTSVFQLKTVYLSQASKSSPISILIFFLAVTEHERESARKPPERKELEIESEEALETDIFQLELKK